MKRLILFLATPLLILLLTSACCDCRKQAKNQKPLVGTSWKLVQLMAHDVSSEGDSYTLVGTRLQARNYNDGVNWINPHYDWGYADNEGTEDFSAERKSNAFDISNAIDAEGNSVALEYINFVKVQSALNTVSGSLGEVSTEVCGFYDYRL